MIQVNIKLLNKPQELQELEQEFSMQFHGNTYVQEIFQSIVNKVMYSENYSQEEEKILSVLGSSNSQMISRCLNIHKMKNLIKKIQEGSTIQQFSQQKSVDLIVIFPVYDQILRPIVEIYCNQLFTYAVHYTASDYIEHILYNKVQNKQAREFFKKIIKEKKYESIVVNDKKIELQTKMRFVLEGNPNKIKLKINTNQMFYEQNKNKQNALNKEIEKPLPLMADKPINNILVQQKKKQKELKFQKKQKSLQRQVQKKQKQQQGQKKQKQIQRQIKKEVVNALSNKKQEYKDDQKQKQPTKHTIQVNIKYISIVGNGGNKDYSFQFKKNMLIYKALPEIINKLKAIDFDWPYSEYDHEKNSDMISILYEGNVEQNFNQTFQKLFGGKDRVEIEINRTYSGG